MEWSGVCNGGVEYAMMGCLLPWEKLKVTVTGMQETLSTEALRGALGRSNRNFDEISGGTCLVAAVQRLVQLSACEETGGGVKKTSLSHFVQLLLLGIFVGKAELVVV